MIHYSSPHTRMAACMIPIVCGLLFACFSFCYLYRYQPEYLAQLQYHFSHGETTYQPLVGASLITLSLLLVGAFFHRCMRWPVRLCALAWFPSAFLLGAVTSLYFTELPDYGSGTHWAALLLLPLCYLLIVCLCLMHPDATGERASLSAYLSSNLLVMAFLFLMTGLLGYDSLPGHRELRMGRLVHEGRYADAMRLRADTTCLTHRLFSLRTTALALEGQLPEHLFEYPIPQGATTLLPAQGDSLFVYNALPILYRAMRAVPRPDQSFHETIFLRNVVLADSLARPLAWDYLLCGYLLRGDLRHFASSLASRTDSLATPLPRHYREALVLCRNMQQGGVEHASREQDQEMEHNFARFCSLKHSAAMGDQQACDSLLAYKGSYWMYYASRFQ